ncbi:MAG: fibronectin type III domain-containing protein, partial [Chloroflexota bacterium]|nr:fibronectin type III domain-containing protein [Chloroflexota bacterium]
QYRVKVAEGETANAWTAHSGTLGATATTFNLSNLTAGATYEVQVRAVTSEEGAGPWSDTGSGRANTPPNLTGVFHNHNSHQ